MILRMNTVNFIRWNGAFLLGLALSSADIVAADTLSRGPYLQVATPTSLVVRWRTAEPSIGRVRYGASAQALSSVANETEAKTEHIVTVTGLKPASDYWYDIGTESTVLAGGSEFRFRTAPASDDAKVRVWVLGDCGTKDASQRAVRDAFYAWNGGSRRADVVLLLGDNAYEAGTDEEYQAAIFDMYPESLRQCVFWSTIGNHELGIASSLEDPSIAYLKIFSQPLAGEAGGVASGTQRYYAFDHGPIHFVCLDSMTSVRATNSAMANWLRNDLAATKKTWIVAFWHHPPYSKGSHDSDLDVELRQMREVFVPILEEYGVDLVLSGHSHSYERSHLIAGHYGPSWSFQPSMKKGTATAGGAVPNAFRITDAPFKGTIYAVPGSAGQTSGGKLNHPAMQVSLNELGSLAFDVSGNQLDAVMIGGDGKVRDRFRLEKSKVISDPVVSWSGESVALAEPGQHATVSLSRRGDLSRPLAVTLDWSGNAQLGVDFSAPKTAQFPSGEAGISVPLTIINDSIIEGLETVTARIEPGKGYVPGAQSTLRIDVQDDEGFSAVIPLVSGDDDSEEVVPEGTISRGSSDLEFGFKKKKSYLIGLRFAAVPIPQGSKIHSAWIQFHIDEVHKEPCKLQIQLQDDVNPTALGEGRFDLTARTRLPVSVPWSPAAWELHGAALPASRTPDLASLLQKMVSNPQWTDSGPMVFFVSGEGIRVAQSANAGASSAPVLQVIWTK